MEGGAVTRGRRTDRTDTSCLMFCEPGPCRTLPFVLLRFKFIRSFGFPITFTVVISIFQNHFTFLLCAFNELYSIRTLALVPFYVQLSAFYESSPPLS